MSMQSIARLQTKNGIVYVYARALPDLSQFPIRKRTKLTHLLVWDLLGSALYAQDGLRHLRCERDANGKPILLHPYWQMNLSHCRQAVVCAIASGTGNSTAVGIDVETPRRVNSLVYQKVCSAWERQALSDSEDEIYLFTQFWTLKEAYAKYTGEGIRLDFSTLDFRIEPQTILFPQPEAADMECVQICLDRAVLGVNKPLILSICMGYSETLEVSCDCGTVYRLERRSYAAN